MIHIFYLALHSHCTNYKKRKQKTNKQAPLICQIFKNQEPRIPGNNAFGCALICRINHILAALCLGTCGKFPNTIQQTVSLIKNLISTNQDWMEMN